MGTVDGCRVVHLPSTTAASAARATSACAPRRTRSWSCCDDDMLVEAGGWRRSWTAVAAVAGHGGDRTRARGAARGRRGAVPPAALVEHAEATVARGPQPRDVMPGANVAVHRERCSRSAATTSDSARARASAPPTTTTWATGCCCAGARSGTSRARSSCTAPGARGRSCAACAGHYGRGKGGFYAKHLQLRDRWIARRLARDVGASRAARRCRALPRRAAHDRGGALHDRRDPRRRGGVARARTAGRRGRVRLLDGVRRRLAAHPAWWAWLPPAAAPGAARAAPLDRAVEPRLGLRARHAHRPLLHRALPRAPPRRHPRPRAGGEGRRLHAALRRRVERSDVVDIDAGNRARDGRRRPRGCGRHARRTPTTASCSRRPCTSSTTCTRSPRHAHRILAPGGVLLVTVPAVSRLAGDPATYPDHWRFTRIERAAAVRGRVRRRERRGAHRRERARRRRLPLGMAAEELGPRPARGRRSGATPCSSPSGPSRPPAPRPLLFEASCPSPSSRGPAA